MARGSFSSSSGKRDRNQLGSTCLLISLARFNEMPPGHGYDDHFLLNNSFNLINDLLYPLLYQRLTTRRIETLRGCLNSVSGISPVIQSYLLHVALLIRRVPLPSLSLSLSRRPLVHHSSFSSQFATGWLAFSRIKY